MPDLTHGALVGQDSPEELVTNSWVEDTGPYLRLSPDDGPADARPPAAATSPVDPEP